MSAPTIATLGKFPATLVRPRSIAAYAVQSRPAITNMLAMFEKHGPKDDDPEDAEVHPKLLDALKSMDGVASRCAALALCWPDAVKWPGKRRPRPWKMAQPIEEWGAEVFDDLIESGIEFGDVTAASMTAYWWLASTTIRQADMDGARDFSEAPTGE
jgi:hypothetical protein